ncbi:MAG: dephospho-CoA kinase [Acidaminobacteraceae bacterium]
MKIIGLTGGIACGKSTISNYLKDKGYVIVDADLVAREVVEVSSQGLKELVASFGDEILNEDKSLNRKKLGAIVFNDKKKLELLNNILHPNIRKKILSYFDMHKQNGEDVIVFDCPLLFEGKYEAMCDETWLVSISYETQIKRLKLRDKIDNIHASKIIDSQMSLTEKAKLADIIIDNEKDVSNLYNAIDELLLK